MHCSVRHYTIRRLGRWGGEEKPETENEQRQMAPHFAATTGSKTRSLAAFLSCYAVIFLVCLFVCSTKTALERRIG